VVAGSTGEENLWSMGERNRRKRNNKKLEIGKFTTTTPT
jgi:hypothetical protein